VRGGPGVARHLPRQSFELAERVGIDDHLLTLDQRNELTDSRRKHMKSVLVTMDYYERCGDVKMLDRGG
jgi:hypothetical protein